MREGTSVIQRAFRVAQEANTCGPVGQFGQQCTTLVALLRGTSDGFLYPSFEVYFVKRTNSMDSIFRLARPSSYLTSIVVGEYLKTIHL